MIDSAPPPANPDSRLVSRGIWPWALGALCLAGGLASGSQWILWEKFLTDAILPCNFVFFFLIAVTIYACQQRVPRLAGLLTLGVCLYGLAGNAWLGVQLMRSLERPYRQLRPIEQGSWDVLVVLGGGTNMAPNEVPQLGPSSGDRVMLAARLYHQGKVGQIICTGVHYDPRMGDVTGSPAWQARAILVDLGVSPERIRQGEGRNTFEEMQYLQRALPEYGAAPRVGLLTSAWHLPRAIRLAKQAGLTVDPVPADFASVNLTFSLRHLLPSPEGFRLTHFAIREHLAGLVGR